MCGALAFDERVIGATVVFGNIIIGFDVTLTYAVVAYCYPHLKNRPTC